MSYVKIKFNRSLLVTKADSPGMYTLGHCLTSDIRSGKKRIEWILDDLYETASSNMTYMEKFDGMIAVGDLFTEDPREAAIVVPIPVLIDLLQQWDEVYKTNPEEVTIYYEYEKFRIEAKPQAAII